MAEEQEVAVVIGGSGDIGRAVAERLTAEGLTVVVSGRTEEKLKDCAKGETAHVMVMDVTDAESVKGAFTEIGERWGRVDLLVNAAGTATKRAPLMRISGDDWDAQHALHSRGALFAAQQAMKLMRKRKSGTIINLVSIAAHQPVVPGYGGYAAAKAAMANLTASINYEGNRFGVRATSLCPTYVDSAVWEGLEMDRSLMLAPSDVADAVMFLFRLAPNVVIREMDLETAAPK